MGENSALSVNSVKRAAFQKASKNQETASVRGILINALVPKGGIRRRPEIINLPTLTKSHGISSLNQVTNF